MEIKLGSFYFKSGKRLDYVVNLILGGIFALWAFVSILTMSSVWLARDSLMATSINKSVALSKYDINVMMVFFFLQVCLNVWWAYDHLKYALNNKA